MTHRPTPFQIRPMEQGDISTVISIDRLSFPTPWSASSYSYEIKHNKTSFYYVLLKPAADEPTPALRRWNQLFKSIAQENDSVIGYVGFRLRGPQAHISTIAVHPDWRGCGLGELLLLTVVEEATERSLGKVTLEVRASNHIAQRLYRKYGFRFTGVQQQYYRDGEDAWLMAVSTNSRVHREHVASLRHSLEARLQRLADRDRPRVHEPVGQKKVDGL